MFKNIRVCVNDMKAAFSDWPDSDLEAMVSGFLWIGMVILVSASVGWFVQLVLTNAWVVIKGLFTLFL